MDLAKMILQEAKDQDALETLKKSFKINIIFEVDNEKDNYNVFIKPLGKDRFEIKYKKMQWTIRRHLKTNLCNIILRQILRDQVIKRDWDCLGDQTVLLSVDYKNHTIFDDEFTITDVIEKFELSNRYLIDCNDNGELQEFQDFFSEYIQLVLSSDFV